MLASRRLLSVVYYATLAVLGTASLATLILVRPVADAPSWLLLVGLGLLNALSIMLVVRLPIDERRGVYLGISDAPFVFTAIVAGPRAILPMIVFDIIIHRLTRKTSGWTDTFLNETHTCMVYLMLVAWFAYALPLGEQWRALAVIVVALLYPVWDALTVSLILSVTTGRDVRSILREKIAPTAWIVGIPIAAGGLAGLLVAERPWYALITVIPLVLAYYAMRAVARWLESNVKVRQLAQQLEQLNTELEARVQERTQEVQRLLELRRRLSDELVHDLKHRVDIIQKTTELVQFCLPASLADRAEIRQSYTILHDSFYAMRGYLGEILDASLLEAGALQLLARPVDLPALVQRVAQQFRAHCAIEGCVLAIERARDLPLVWCDEPRVERVVFNVLDNAIRYAVQMTEQTSGSAVVRVSFSADAREVACVIEDNGPGIDQEHLAQLGAWGTRLAGDVRRVDGTGLGLAFCIRILALSQGRLTIESPGIGEGSRVTIALPVAVTSITAITPQRQDATSVETRRWAGHNDGS